MPGKGAGSRSEQLAASPRESHGKGQGVDWRESRGSSEVISFLGIIPFVLLLLLTVTQFTLMGYVLVVLESAARDAARAAAARESVMAVVDRAAETSKLTLTAVEECPPGRGYVRVTVTAEPPSVLIPISRLGLFPFERTVVMPREGNC